MYFKLSPPFRISLVGLVREGDVHDKNISHGKYKEHPLNRKEFLANQITYLPLPNNRLLIKLQEVDISLIGK